MDRGHKALLLTIFFGICELAAWTLLGSIQAANSKLGTGYWQNFWLYCALHFGDFVVGITATAYVLFTYQLLQSAEDARRHSAEPHLTIRWYHAGAPTERRLAEFQELAIKGCQWLSGLSSGAIGLDQLPPSERRYIVVEFYNSRPTPVSWVLLSITASAAAQGVQPQWTMRTATMRLDGLRIEQGHTLAITVLDIGSILAAAQVQVQLDTFIYGPAEQDVQIEKWGGSKEYSSPGLIVPGPIAVIGPTVAGGAVDPAGPIAPG